MKILLTACLLLPGQFMHAQSNLGKRILINEIMADPSPPVALPVAEYVELYNASTDTINLFKWTIQVGDATTTINSSFLLGPGKYVVCCPQNMGSLFDSAIQVIGLTAFPPIHNDEAVIQVLDADRKIMHAVAFNKNWYRNSVKANGGWSLELIDRSKPCLASENWKASIHLSGGTPGKLNSVVGEVNDDSPPRLLRAFCTDSVTIIALFNESLDVFSASQPSSFGISKGTIRHAAPIDPFYNTIKLTLDQPLQKGVECFLEVKAVRDCIGNTIGNFRKVKVGIPEQPVAASIVINEILFNPETGGSDYVELFNASGKLFDLKDLFLASRNATNGLQSIIPCSHHPHLIFSGDHIVFTTDSLYTIQRYLVKEPGNIVELPALPSMPDNAGSVVLTTSDSKVIDEVKYSEQWHFPLLKNLEGVSLERLSFKVASNDPSNWTSAAASAGFGTPTYRNSQMQNESGATGTFSIVPTVFSPDGDGNQDFATIEFNLDRTGMMGTITIFDMRGRPVRMLVSNTSLAQTGSFRWNGLNMHEKPAAPGMYVVVMDVFNLQGVRKKYKAAVVVAAGYQ